MTPAALNAAVVGYMVVACISYVAYRFQVQLISRIGESFLRDLRLRVFDHLQRLSMPFYDREKAGVIVSRMTSDVDSLQELVQMGLLMFVSNGILLAVSVVVLAVVSWKLLLLCLICVPFVVLASIKFQRDSNKAYLDVRDGIGNTLSQLQEGIAGVRVVQAFGREDVEAERFQHGNQRLFDAHMRSVKISAWYLPVIEFSGLITTAIAVGVGGYWVYTGDLSVGTVTFFVLTLSNLFEPIQQLSQLFNIVQSAGASLNKLFELLDTPVDVPERVGAVDLPERGEIEVDGRRVRLRRRAARAPRRRPAHPGRRPPRARRPHRRRQVHPRQAHRAPLRPHRGCRPLRRASTSATRRSARCGSASWSCRRRGSSSTARSWRTSASPAPAPPTRRCWPPSTPSASASASRCSPRASTPRSASAAPACRRGRSSSCPSPAPRWPTPPCWCSTRPPPASTPARRWWSSRR